MPEARVSVVIPSYNRAHCLEHTVTSVLQQTVSAAEVIVVDDGSLDNTKEVVSGFPKPVKYVHRENGGVSAARNTGIAHATGTHIALLDADDVWLPRKLEIQLAALARFPQCGWCTTDHVVTDVDGMPVPGEAGVATGSTVFAEVGLEPDAFFAQDMSAERIVAGGSEWLVFVGDLFGLAFCGNTVFPSGALMTRQALDSAGWFDEEWRLAEETEFFHRLAARSPVSIVREPLFEWRRGRPDTLVSHSNIAVLLRNAVRSLDKASALRPMSAVMQERMAAHRRRLLRNLAYTNLSDHDRRACRAAVREARSSGEPWLPWLLPIMAGSLVPGPMLELVRLARRRTS